MLTGCKPSDSKAADTHAVVSPGAAPATTQPRFTVADFSRLRWLAGDWQSRTQNGKSFYDRYRVIDDSTMRQASFSDSTFRTQKDSALIGLRGGRVIDRGDGAPWFATRIDTNGANFESQAAAANHFVWTQVSPDRWTTQIFITDGTGAETKTVYQVERVKRK
jgi:hypothetical protein